jgi:hypothetical protein
VPKIPRLLHEYTDQGALTRPGVSDERNKLSVTWRLPSVFLLVILHQAAESGKLLEPQLSIIPAINRKPEGEHVLLVLLLSLLVRPLGIYNLFEQFAFRGQFSTVYGCESRKDSSLFLIRHNGVTRVIPAMQGQTLPAILAKNLPALPAIFFTMLLVATSAPVAVNSTQGLCRFDLSRFLVIGDSGAGNLNQSTLRLLEWACDLLSLRTIRRQQAHLRAGMLPW